MSAWKKAMDYLGLGPDDAYDDYDLPPAEPERPVRGRSYDEPRNAHRPRGGYGYDEPEPPRTGSTRTLPRDLEPVPARPRPSPADDSGVVPRPSRQGSAVRAVPPPTGEPYTVRPRRFDQAQELADKFKEGLPVIMNLETAERDVSRRLIDFASGLCYALDGTMEKVATGVYLLKPPSMRHGYDD